MNLQQFIGEALIQIINGVNDARTSTTLTNSNGTIRARVNPKITGGVSAADLRGHMISSYGELVHMVKFDVAVTTEQSSDAKIGGGIRVVGIGLGSDLSTNDKNTSLSRVTFEVPVAFPHD